MPTQYPGSSADAVAKLFFGLNSASEVLKITDPNIREQIRRLAMLARQPRSWENFGFDVADLYLNIMNRPALTVSSPVNIPAGSSVTLADLKKLFDGQNSAGQGKFWWNPDAKAGFTDFGLAIKPDGTFIMEWWFEAGVDAHGKLLSVDAASGFPAWKNALGNNWWGDFSITIPAYTTQPESLANPQATIVSPTGEAHQTNNAGIPLPKPVEIPPVAVAPAPFPVVVPVGGSGAGFNPNAPATLFNVNPNAAAPAPTAAPPAAVAQPPAPASAPSPIDISGIHKADVVMAMQSVMSSMEIVLAYLKTL